MISERINKIANLIDLNSKGVYDVGSDHGYLLVLLRNKSETIRLKGVENKIEPFNNLKNNTKGLNIESKLSDGIDDLTDDFSCLVMAGMGFNTIEEIVLRHKEKLDYIEQIVIDSHTNIDLSRKFFIDLGYYIDNEIILKEKGIFYEVISFKKGIKNYNNKEIKYGPILLKEKNEIFIEKYKLRNLKIEEISSKLDKNSARFKELIEEHKENSEAIL